MQSKKGITKNLKRFIKTLLLLDSVLFAYHSLNLNFKYDNKVVVDKGRGEGVKGTKVLVHDIDADTINRESL